MFLSDLSIKRPVFAAVMMLALVTLGVFSYRRLALDLYPNVDVPVLIVTTQYPGGSPESVEREVTKKIEEAINPIAGVKHVVSNSLEGVSIVVVQFQLEIKINEALQEAQAKVQAIRGSLPLTIEEPVIQKFDFSAMPVVSMAVKSETLSPRELSTVVEKLVKPRLENISGVGKVDLVGLSKREVNVNVDPLRLDSFSMGVDELIGGLRSENVNTPLGRIKSGLTEAPLRVSGKPGLVAGFNRIAIAGRNGRTVELGQVADIVDGIEEQRTLAFVNGVPAIGIDIQKQSGANTVEVVDAAMKSLAKLKGELPPGTSIEVVRDASVFIRESVEDVENSLVLGGLLTILIVFCFLNSWRSTVITGLTLPISVVASFIVMNFMGMTLNMMTLMALSLAIGLLIDDAIVVRENIVRHLEMGKDHFTAAREGTAEIGLAVLATSFSIIAVFVPVAFMKGIVGRFFFSFGITVAFAVLVSLFVSFTLDPMLSSRWHDPDIERKGKRHLVARLLDSFNDWFDRAADRYKVLIGWALDHRKTTMAAALAAFVGGIMIFGSLESSFMVGFDKGEFSVGLKSSPDASINETENRLEAVLGEIRSLPEVQHTYATIGANNSTVRDALIYVKLKDKNERVRSQDEVQRDLRSRLVKVPGIVSSIMEADSFQGQKALQVNLRGEDLGLLKKYGQQLKAEIYKIPGIVDLEVTLEHDVPEFQLTVDRERAADAGLSTGSIAGTLGALVGGQAVTTYEDEDGDAVDVRVRLPENLRGDMETIGRLRIAAPGQGTGGSTALVPLGGLISYNMEKTPSQIDRQDLSRQVVISANLDGLPIGTAVQKVAEAAKNVPMEPGYRVVFSGEAEDMAESFGYMAEALLMAIIFVYLILAAQFESFIDPLSIMLSLPLSLVGMAGMLKMTGDTISIMSLIGLIMLMGLVTKNAILLVDYAKILGKGGMEKREALITAGRTRLRPIMMTTLAMIFGMLPLALALGAGAEMRAPMARAVIGGLITSTILTLLVVPVVYSVLDDFGGWIKRKWRSGIPVDETTPESGVKKLLVSLLIGLFLTAAGAPLAYTEEGGKTSMTVLTLEEALKLSSEQSKDIKKARELKNQYYGIYVQERASVYPQVTATANLLRQEDDSQSRLGVPGTATNIAGAGVNVSQVLYTWGQLDAAVRAAEIGMQTADDELRVARQEAALTVTSTFYDLLLVKELNALAVQNLQQREKHLEEAKKKLAAGVATDYDLLSAEVAVKNAKPEVSKTQNQIRLLRDRLRFQLGIEEGEVDVKGSLEVVPSPAPGYEVALKSAKENRPELAALQKRLEVYGELVTIAKAGDKPRLDFRGSYGYSSINPDGSAESDGTNWSAGIFATWPIFDGKRTQGRTAQLASEAAGLRIDEQKLLDGLALGVRDAQNNVREAEEVLAGLEGTVAQAEKLLSMAQKGYEFGVKTKLDVDDALLNLTLAKSNLAGARRNYLVARATLEFAMGVLGDKI
ncbi:RND transporter [bacterium]|nr:MAG: RND transporter [bacterium]